MNDTLDRTELAQLDALDFDVPCALAAHGSGLTKCQPAQSASWVMLLRHGNGTCTDIVLPVCDAFAAWTLNPGVDCLICAHCHAHTFDLREWFVIISPVHPE